MKCVKILAGTLLALWIVSGCNTVAGLGKDLQAGGEAISQTSIEVRDHLTGEPAPVETASTEDAS